MVGRIEGDIAVRSREVSLDDCDAVIVRGVGTPARASSAEARNLSTVRSIARGPLTHVTPPACSACSASTRKMTCSSEPRGMPRTIACERVEDALEAFEELGGDVIVKPLFGSMGAGMTRVDDADVAYRVFHALELERAVYYLQEALPHDGRDLRALVVGGRVLAAIERVGSGWRANLARGARAHAAQLSAEQERLCLQAAEVLGVDYAGVDLLRAADGREYVLELNSIPGWRGLQEATGADVAAALVEHAEALVSEARPARAGR